MDFNWMNQRNRTDSKLRIANVVQRTWLFCGGHGKKYFEIEISAENRETAIAYLEREGLFTIGHANGNYYTLTQLKNARVG